MFARLLAGLTNRNRGIRPGAVHQSLDAAFLQFGIWIQHEYKFGASLSGQQVHTFGETVIGP